MTGTSALIFSAVAPGVYFLLHGILSRFLRRLRLPPQKIAAITCVLGASLQMNGWLLGLGISAESLAFAFLISFCTAHVYFHYFNMSETARRIRYLVARYLGKPIGEPADGATQKTILRIRRLRELGAVTRQGNQYRIRPGLLSVTARLMVAYESWIFPERFRPRG